MGEIWQISKRVEKETKQIARSVFSMMKSQERPERNSFDNVLASPGVDTDTIVPQIQALGAGWQDAGQLEYFNGWDDLTGVNRIGT